MKNYCLSVIAIVCFTICFNQTASGQIKQKTTQNVKSQKIYSLKDIKGIWLTTQGYDIDTGESFPAEDNNKFGLGFTNAKSNGQLIAFRRTANDNMERYVYTIRGNKIKMYYMENRQFVGMTLEILSLTPNEKMTAIVTQYFLGEPLLPNKFDFMFIDANE